MAVRYVITLTDKNAAQLEKWISGSLIIGPAEDPKAVYVSRIKPLDLTEEN
jgi:hypothetical protein